MVIKIQEPKKEGYNRQLKLSKLLPFEYAIVSKEKADPATGTTTLNGQTKTWNLYSVSVHEFVTLDPKTGQNTTEKPDEVMSYFPSEKAAEQLKSIPVGVKVKIRAEEIEGNNGTFTKYIVEPLEKIEEETSVDNSAPAMSLDDRVKTLKEAGVDADTALALLSKEFDVADSIIAAKLRD